MQRTTIIIFIFFILLLTVSIFLWVYLDNSKKSLMKKMPEVHFIEKQVNASLPQIARSREIPKVFHRTHKSKEIINMFQDVEDKIRLKHPDYDIINYDEEDILKFIKEHYDERILTAYKSIKSKYGAAQADFFRYLLIYVKGGIYLDIKSGPTKNLDPLLKKYKNRLLVSRKNMLFVSFWELFFPYGENIQWCIIAPKGHPVIKEMILQTLTHIEFDYTPKKNFYGEYGTLCLAGPVPYTYITNKKENKGYVSHLDSNFDNYITKYLTDYPAKRPGIKEKGGNHYAENKDYIIEKYTETF